MSSRPTNGSARCPSPLKTPGAVLAALATFLGCSPPMLDRTQPNFLKKSDLLDATWYWQETIVDAPKTPASAAVVGYAGDLEKIRWEIQEELLVGYRAYELVPGADPRVDRERSSIGQVVFLDGRPYRGNPVVGYKIRSHFDRQRLYNPATGEQSNVLVEDTQDRPWHQREFMRVDFSTNLVKNNDSDCTNPIDSRGCVRGVGRFLKYTTAQDQNPNDEAMVFERDAAGRLTYFDFTTQAVVDPPTVHYPRYGDVPVCLLGSPQYDCESQNVKIRTSILRVNDNPLTAYEPLPYNDKLMVKFGFFQNTQYTYDKDYYYTYSGTQKFAIRHNIWAETRERRFDVAAGEVKMVTKPVIQRPLKPIVYYLSANTPRELWSVASQRWAREAGRDPQATIEASWDYAFRRAVAVPRGRDPFDPAIPQMFIVCETPVQEGAPAECGPAGRSVRSGDLRYHTIPYVEQNAGGLLGLGPSSVDPETGEIIKGSANFYGVAIDALFAGPTQQLVDVLNGEVALDDLVLGKDVKDYVLAHLNPTDPRRPPTGPWSSRQPLTSEPTRPLSSMNRPQGRLGELVEVWKGDGHLPLARQNRRAVVEELLLRHPALEEQVYRLPEVRLGVEALSSAPGFRSKVSSDPEFYTQVARDMLLGKDPVETLRAEFRAQVGSRVGCFYEHSYDDEDFLGAAKQKLELQRNLIARFQLTGHPTCSNPSACNAAEAKALAKAEVFQELRREAYRSITEHEVGHTLGLYHNFAGTADALNYQDGYWDLRKETIGVLVGGQRVFPTLPENLVDAAKLNQRQLEAGLSEYAYSSIMDYGSRTNSQNKGIGKYDAAAILFGYAGGYEPGWVEVFNELRTDYAHPNLVVPVDNSAKAFTVRGAHVEIPLAIAEHYTPSTSLYTDRFHYSTLPFHFAKEDPVFTTMLDDGIRRMGNRSYRKWSEMERHYQRISTEIKNYALNAGGFSKTDYVRARDIIGAAGGKAIPVEVPYMFCSDYELGANLMCNARDQGADVYEMTSKLLERFRQSYVFGNFRRDRLFYSPATVASGKFSRYLAAMPNVYQQWLFNIYQLQNYYSLTTEELDRFFGLGDPMYQNYWTMAVVDSTNLLMQQLAVPSVGYHGRRDNGTWEYVGSGDPHNRRLEGAAERDLSNRLLSRGYRDVLYIPRGPGRSMFTVHDTTGYDNFVRVNEAGHFWDVYAAILALTTSQTNFLGVDRGSDALRYSLPYYMTFHRELSGLFGAYWMEAPERYAPLLTKLPDGTGQVTLPAFVRASDYVTGFEYPVEASGNSSQVWEKVLPNPPWSARFYAEVWGMAFFTDNYNQEFANFNRVYRLGSNENLTPATGFEVVTLADPFGGGYVYAALKKTGDRNPPPAPALVERAVTWNAKWREAVASGAPVDDLTAAQWEHKVRDIVRTLEMMRGLFAVFGQTL